jgi:hypothetical protein
MIEMDYGLCWMLQFMQPGDDGRLHLFGWPEQLAYLSGIWLMRVSTPPARTN